jgi:nucleotide-binding universal stress UspA family protein
MSFSFKTILIPVDFSINTEVAINKALEVADKDGADIHLLHVSDHTAYRFLTKDKKPGELIQKTASPTVQQMIQQWKNSIQETTPHTVYNWIQHHSSIQDSIEEKAQQLNADLIVIGKKSNHSWFPFLNTVIPSELAEVTGSAVLTVKPGSLHNKIKTLVVPVTGDIPKYKMEAIAALCKKNRLKVHLVSFVNGENIPADFSASTLLKLYQWLKEALHCPVEYAVLHGTNKAKAVLLYAEKVNADILLLNPTSETKMGWLNKHISDVLSPASKVQVLAVHGSN